MYFIRFTAYRSVSWRLSHPKLNSALGSRQDQGMAVRAFYQASASFGGYKIVIEQSRHQEFTVHRGWCRTLSADRAAANVQHLVGDRACSIEHEPGPPKRWVAWRSLSLWVGASVRNGRQPVIGAVPRQRAGQVRVTFSHLSQSSSTRRRVKIVSSALQSLG